MVDSTGVTLHPVQEETYMAHLEAKNSKIPLATPHTSTRSCTNWPKRPWLTAAAALALVIAGAILFLVLYNPQDDSKARTQSQAPTASGTTTETSSSAVAEPALKQLITATATTLVVPDDVIAPPANLNGTADTQKASPPSTDAATPALAPVATTNNTVPKPAANESLATVATVFVEGGPSKYSLNHTIDATGMDYDYMKILGDSFLFLEAQRSGHLSNAPGGNRIEWRGDQLLKDGSDVGLDLEGGYYEAGNRLKVTLPTAYSIARIAMGCYKHQDAYTAMAYNGKSMLHWCMREVRWGAEWLLKTHAYAGPKRTAQWNTGDRFVIQVGTVPGDWQCYDRAEVLPTAACPQTARATLLASDTAPAADVAGEAAAALAASAVLLQASDPTFATEAITASHALYDFAVKFPKTAGLWSLQVQKTYPSSSAAQHILWAASVLAWAHTCEGADDVAATCSVTAATKYLGSAQLMWGNPEIANRRYYLVSNWDNPVFDSALVLEELTQAAGSDYRNLLENFVSTYINTGGEISATPKGLRRFVDETWASLRLATFGSHTALSYALLPFVPEVNITAARCLARSQLGYAVGDTGYSYVVGFGKDYPQQVHHRDAACTLAESAAGECMGSSRMFNANRPNPHVVTGSIVGGPDTDDKFLDVRKEYHYTEIALDYNTGLTTALTAMIAVPPSFWSVDCSTYVPEYPWS